MGTYQKARMKTKQHIQDVFLELYKRNPIGKITVKQITNLAGYSKGTFYLYFKDIYEVLETIENELIKESGNFDLTYRNHITIDEMITESIRLFRSYGNELSILLSENGNPDFIIKYKSQMKQNIIKMVESRSDTTFFIDDFQLEYVVSGMLSSIIYWFNEKPFEEDELFRRIIKLVNSGITI